MGDFVMKHDRKRKHEQPSLRLFRITDFALHVTEPYMGDIDEIVSKWEDWLK
jgi:hypothetical protein